MTEDEVVQFLKWLEQASIVRLEFTDKQTLAKDYVGHRSFLNYRQFTLERGGQ